MAIRLNPSEGRIKYTRHWISHLTAVKAANGLKQYSPLCRERARELRVIPIVPSLARCNGFADGRSADRACAEAAPRWEDET
jgi:hypothetical protein